jgi:hypothetical protein
MVNGSEKIQEIGSKKIHRTQKCGKVNWRVDPKLFRFDSEDQNLLPGSDEYSAGWFAQAHTVSSDLCRNSGLQAHSSLRGQATP